MPSRDSKRQQQGNYNNYGSANGRGGGAPRNHVVPDEPPFTAYIGNAPESMVQGDFENHLFIGLKVKQVRLVRDRQTDRFRGFAYVDFEDADSLRRAIELDGTCINDRPIKIDVAARPLGANKSEGFRSKPGFASQDNRRPPSGNGNNRSNGGMRQGGRNSNSYSQQGPSQNVEDGYPEEEYYPDRNRRSSGSIKMNERRPSLQYHVPSSRKHSTDDAFAAPDTPGSHEDGLDQGETTIVRQQSRNWADCPIDETGLEPSPPPSANNTFTSDDFQVVRNKTPKSRNPPARSAGNQSSRGRNNGNYTRGGAAHGYYDQYAPQYSNQAQQYYQQHQMAPTSHRTGLSYHTNNQNQNNNNRHAPPPPPSSAGYRQRLNSNRSNASRNYDNDHSQKGQYDDGNDTNLDSVPAENRPRLQLLPRSQKPSSSTDDKPVVENASRNASIFGSGKPRDERDPKLAELNKHIEEVVEKEQHTPENVNAVTNPVRILSAAS